MKSIIIDLDGTLTHDIDCDYANKPLNQEIYKKLIEYKKMGFKIIINTSRNMKTFSGNIGQINAKTLPKIITWLDKHKVPYDEIIVGKPWCGYEGFYIDDKAIRPSEFINKTYEEIQELLALENPYKDGGNK